MIRQILLLVQQQKWVNCHRSTSISRFRLYEEDANANDQHQHNADGITIKRQGTLILLGVSVGFVAGWEEFDLSFLVRSHSMINNGVGDVVADDGDGDRDGNHKEIMMMLLSMMKFLVMMMTKYQGGCFEPTARQLCEEQDERKLHWKLHKEGVGLETGDDDDYDEEEGDEKEGVGPGDVGNAPIKCFTLT